jgi:restriction system protein
MAPPRSRRRPASTRRRGSSRRRSRRLDPSLLAFAVAVALLAGVAVVNWLREHPTVLISLLVGVAVIGGTALTLYLTWQGAKRRRRLALTRSIEVADRLTGPQFEQWVADLLRRSGFTQVEVSGGAGDLGADVTALAPDRRRVVIQCKRYAVDRRVGSPDVQRFAGTARQLHGADIAAIVTTSTFTQPAADTAARLGIRLIDRELLTRWAADGLLPVALAHHVAPNPVQETWGSEL